MHKLLETFANNLHLTPNDKVVFCDMDGTLYRNSLFLEYMNVLKEKFFTEEQKQKAEDLFIQWQTRKVTYDDYLLYMVDISDKHMTAEMYDYMDNPVIIERIVNTVTETIYLSTYRKLEEYKNMGYKIIILSGSQHDLITHVVQKMGYYAGFGTYTGYDDKGVFGTHYILARGDDKIELIEYIKNRYHLQDYVAFGDTMGDFKMLSHAKEGYAINPNSKLYNAVKDLEHVQVIVERKDMIYALPKAVRKLMDDLSCISTF